MPTLVHQFWLRQALIKTVAETQTDVLEWKSTQGSFWGFQSLASVRRVVLLGIVLLGAPASSVIAAGMPVQAPAQLQPLQDKVRKQSFAAQKADKEWYEQGVWPIVAPTLALVITNAVAIYIVYLQSSRSFKSLLRQRRIERLSASLSNFYIPLLALIDINGAIFSSTGPNSFPKQEPSRSAAALIWNETKKKILSNNQQIETILRSQSHLIAETDSLQHYHSLLIHVAMYETFQRVETDIYRSFLFPSEVKIHITEQRGLVIVQLNKVSGEDS